MSTKTLLKNYIDERTESLGPYPDIVQSGIETISGEVPFKLKLAITLSELITFASHLRKPIELYDGTLVPTNAIVFALSASGTSKDKSLNALRKSLSSGYEQLEEHRKEYAKDRAEKLAKLEGEGAEMWQKYYIAPKPLQAGLGTVEGLMHHFADIASNPMGAGSILSSEIGSELQNNGAMTDIIKVISVAYDLGNIPPKIVKSSENQTGAVKGLPVNALFFGSQEGILYNNDIKNKFRLVFNTQLARRCIFTFTPEVPERIEITSIDELYEQREQERIRTVGAQHKLNKLTADLVNDTTSDPLTVTPEANKLYDVYLEYNAIISDEQSGKYPISKLSRKHKQWLALKLSAVYAILNAHEEITEELFAYAINTVEYLSPDISKFERELVKEPYEQLSDMCRYNSEKGKYFVSLHELRKLSYITGAGTSKTKVDEMVTLANSYDKKGTYTVHEGGIKFEELKETDIVTVSWKHFPDLGGDDKSNKEFMARNSSEGYELYETDFEELTELLSLNAAYCSFKFEDGIRRKENLYGGTKFVILDIDKSMLTDVEAHTLLNDFNHYVVRTSDKNNAFKFRVILELDAIIEVDERMWKAFIQELADDLGLVIDVLPQSQIFLSFAGRDVLSQLDGKTIKTKFILDNAAKRLRDKPSPPSKLPSKEKNALLNDPRETFNYAFEAEKGERSVKIYRALAHAIDLGADADYVDKLAREINSYYIVPLSEDRLDRTLITPALRRI